MDYLEEAKKELASSLRIEDPAQANMATFSAIAFALIALVERLDAMTEDVSIGPDFPTRLAFRTYNALEE